MRRTPDLVDLLLGGTQDPPCPSCGARDAEEVATRRFQCLGCGYRWRDRDADDARTIRNRLTEAPE